MGPVLEFLSILLGGGPGFLIILGGLDSSLSSMFLFDTIHVFPYIGHQRVTEGLTLLAAGHSGQEVRRERLGLGSLFCFLFANPLYLSLSLSIYVLT